MRLAASVLALVVVLAAVMVVLAGLVAVVLRGDGSGSTRGLAPVPTEPGDVSVPGAPASGVAEVTHDLGVPMAWMAPAPQRGLPRGTVPAPDDLSPTPTPTGTASPTVAGEDGASPEPTTSPTPTDGGSTSSSPDSSETSPTPGSPSPFPTITPDLAPDGSASWPSPFPSGSPSTG